MSNCSNKFKHALQNVVLATFLSVSCGSLLFSDQIAVSSFKLLNSNENSTIIDPAEAQDLLNVDITPSGKSVKKRPGYGLYKNVFATSTGVHGGVHAFDSTGNDVQIWASSVSVKGIVADGTPNTIVSSMTVNSTIDCADTQGSIYCVDSNRDFFIRTNGTTLTQWYTSPLGTMVESTPDRVIVAGVSATPNTLFVSQSNTFTNFVTGVLNTDAFTEVIASPGSKLTHIRWGCQKLLWWKDQSFGYFDFEDQYSAQVKIVSDNIGTQDNTSAIDPGGNVWFRGQDGHTYKYDCSGLEKMTVDITPQIQSSGRRTSNSWTQTTASDWNSGSLVPSAYFTVANNSLSFAPGYNVTFSTAPTFNSSDWNAVSGVTFSVGVASMAATATTASMTYKNSLSSTTYYQGFQSSATFQWDHENSTNGTLRTYLTDTSGNGFVVSVLQNGNEAGPFVLYMNQVSGGSLGTQMCSGNGSTFNTSTHSFSIRLTSGTGVISTLFDGSIVCSSATTSQYSLKYSTITWAGDAVHTVTIKVSNFSLNGVMSQLATSTGTFYSAVKNAPNIASFSTFNPTTSGEGNQAFYMRSSSNSFTVLSSTPAWTLQTANSQVVVTTYTYFQVADSFTVTMTTQVPALNSFTVNWFEGNSSDQAYMLFFDNAIWESVSYGVGISSNNYIFRYDLINGGWGLYYFGANGMLIQGNRLFFGSVTDGNVYQFGSGTSDNGTAINAYWKAKDFTGNDPFLQNQLTQIDTFAKKNQNQTLTATYSLDTSTTTNSYSISLSTASSSITQSRKLLPSGKTGYTFNIQYGDNSTGSAWELLGFRIGYVTQPYRPSQ